MRELLDALGEGSRLKGGLGSFGKQGKFSKDTWTRFLDWSWLPVLLLKTLLGSNQSKNQVFFSIAFMGFFCEDSKTIILGQGEYNIVSSKVWNSE